jgi:hypothetical protein
MGQEYIETLKKAREQLVMDRRACVQTLAEASTPDLPGSTCYL